jgi:predicted restriction endonuclease
LDRYWDRRCVLTGIDRRELLRASHIKPWSVSSDAERRDPFNGLLLAVHVDALFDHALISFGEAGQMLVSSRLSEREQMVFGLMPSQQTVPLTPAHQGYLRHHRERFAAIA